MLAQFFIWWYGEGWRTQSKLGWRRVNQTSRAFSAPLLLSTLFAPWRRIITNPGASLQAKMQAAGDNLVSRAVGFTVRIFVLITAGVMLLALSAFTVFIVIFWPLIPLLILFGIIWGLI
ncbi:MAG TPA: hypothetical protein VLG47_01620 [Candidatus Saccharimonadales bacterium]|nr:hypothetical protein [Candidatus Saccharimonadales bacterium]